MRQVEHSEHMAAPHHGRRVEVLLAGLKDPLNVGQAFRTCLSLGVARLHLCDATPTPPSAKLNRTARGAQHYLPWSAGATAEVMKSFGESTPEALILGVEYAHASGDIRAITPVDDTPILLVLGNEAHGIQPTILELCDEVVHLPMYGAISSYNVATALALSLWEIVR